MPEEKITVKHPNRYLGLEYCEICKQNFPVRIEVVSSLDVGVHLQLSGFHIHMGSDEPVELPPRLIRIDDLEDFREIGKVLKAEITRVQYEVDERERKRAQEEPESVELCEHCGEPIIQE